MEARRAWKTGRASEWIRERSDCGDRLAGYPSEPPADLAPPQPVLGLRAVPFQNKSSRSFHAEMRSMADLHLPLSIARLSFATRGR
jgi:hypothetical protein